MASNTYLLSIDFGTESVRAAIFDLAGRPVPFAATMYRTTHPHPGWAEQDPEEWWKALQASCRKVIAASGTFPAVIKGISYNTTTMTVVATDKRGETLHPAITWMDVRATEQVARAERSDSAARPYNGRDTAPAAAEQYPFKAVWLRENERETYDAVFRLVDAPDWVTYKLAGEWTTNVNSAALCMYYNRDHGGWPIDFYETIGYGGVFDKIPEKVVDLGTSVGELSAIVTQLLGLHPGTPVAQGPADAWAEQIGLGVIDLGAAVLITGFSHVLTGQTDEPIHGRGFFGAYTDGVVKGQYTVEGGQVSTGLVLKWSRDNPVRDLIQAAEVTGFNVYDILNEQSKDLPPGSDDLIINEYFQGNRTPYTDSKARGVIWGLPLHHDPAHIYRAIQESVCYGTAHNLRAMSTAGFEVKKIVAVGGTTKNRDWMQTHANVAGVPITLTEVDDAVVLGSCMLAAVDASFHPDLRTVVREMVHEIDLLEPNQRRHEEYQYFIDAYANTYPQFQPMIRDMVDHENAKRG